MRRMMKLGKIILSGLLLLGMMNLKGSLAEENGPEKLSPIQRLLNKDVAVRRESARLIRADYETTVAELVRIVGQTKGELQIFDDPRLLAVELLGDMRATAAVDVLIANIDVDYPRISHELENSAGTACADALIKIGKPGSLGCLRAVSAENDERRMRLLVEVIRRVEGERFGKMMVLEAAQNEKDASKRINLEKAAKVF